MKKITLLIALASTTLIGYSQDNNAKIDSPDPVKTSPFSIGFKGGFGHSFQVPYSNTVFCPSWDAGISAIYSLREHWGVGLDLLYSKEGVKFKYTNPVTKQENTTHVELDYVRIPGSIIYFFGTYANDFRPKVAIGPSLGILVSEKNSVNAASIDLGAQATLGFNYRLAKAIWLNVDATYYQGFLDVYSNNNDNDWNGNVRLNAGVNFGF